MRSGTVHSGRSVTDVKFYDHLRADSLDVKLTQEDLEI